MVGIILGMNFSFSDVNLFRFQVSGVRKDEETEINFEIE